MSEVIPAPEVSAEDVLAGQKTITVRTRRGEDARVTVRALSWRKALQASQCFANGANDLGVELVLQSQRKPLSTDEFLDTIAPAWLPVIAGTAMLLSNGVDAAKKTTAREDARPTSAGLDSPTSSPSSAS